MKNIVLIAVGVLSVSLFAFVPASNPQVTPLANGNYLHENLDLLPSDEARLARWQNNDLTAYGVLGFVYRCESTTSDRFTRVTIAGSGCSKAATEVLSPGHMAASNDARPHVDAVMVRYMNL